MCLAHQSGGGWQAGAPEPVGEPTSLLARLVAQAEGGPVALGLDLPLGLPRAYAAQRKEANFPTFLRALAPDSPFFVVCEQLEEAGPDRPFFPRRALAGRRPGLQAELAAALGLKGREELYRACDCATAERPAGAPVFWTIGANQSGKAAIVGWREVLGPALRGPDPPLLWPFAGPFRSLLQARQVAVAETYPGEALCQLGLKLRGSKRRREDRATMARGIAVAMARLKVKASGLLAENLREGFGADPAGEDRFDCLLGLLCVIGVLSGTRPDTAPEDSWIGRWEGWVLGQTALPRLFDLS